MKVQFKIFMILKEERKNQGEMKKGLETVKSEGGSYRNC